MVLTICSSRGLQGCTIFTMRIISPEILTTPSNSDYSQRMSIQESVDLGVRLDVCLGANECPRLIICLDTIAAAIRLVTQELASTRPPGTLIDVW